MAIAIGVIAVVTFVALAIVVSGGEWAVGIAGAGIFLLVLAAALFGKGIGTGK